MADVIEFQTWATNKSSTYSSIMEQLESALDSSVIEQLENAPDGEEKSGIELVAQYILDEFQSRQQILGSAYPFTSDGQKLEIAHANPATTTYLFCLGLSLLPSSEIEFEQRTRQFETIVMEAAKEFWGGCAMRIGAPWRTEAIADYGALLDKVIELLPDLGEKLRTDAPNGGDAGWDVLIVKGFCDKRFPRFVALGNCATGRSDWLRKGMEAQPGLFWSYFQGSPRSVSVTFFAVPFTMDDEARLRKYSASCMTFDRYRICEHAPMNSVTEATIWIEGQKENALELPLN